MAIVFQGLSTCPLCEEVLDERNAYTMFPPLCGNAKEALYIFSDAAVHVDCLQKHPLCEMALSARNQMDEHRPSPASVCLVDGKIITDRHDIVFIGLLTSDPSEDLHRFNFLTLNRNNIAHWEDRDEFLTAVKQFSSDGKWEQEGPFNYLVYIINELT
ncbi:hypothetical protein [Chitinophaga flava]|uniref:Uncharacterized protein n=1 Tax=Chitinophaga flava TaxID=2259036 RepID=A0A365Y100_9BACT|nr:hypothetical protein [Chitinophaga flava]RBL92283.1 hypothetical protein DF182_06745 [Chitinophaga flava]